MRAGEGLAVGEGRGEPLLPCGLSRVRAWEAGVQWPEAVPSLFAGPMPVPASPCPQLQGEASFRKALNARGNAPGGGQAAPSWAVTATAAWGQAPSFTRK